MQAKMPNKITIPCGIAIGFSLLAPLYVKKYGLAIKQNINIIMP